MLEAFGEALSYLANPLTIGYILLGNITGLIFGVLPGLGGAAALAILLPLTSGLNPITAMFFLASVMGAVPFGGSIPAILLNTPGTPVNAATCLDGYPMARKGEARKALEIAATASGLGALFGVFVLILVLPLVRRIILLFGPPEFLILFLFGLATVAIASKGSFLKGLIAGGVGMLLSFAGYSPVFGDLRFTFGSEYLWDGLPLVPVLVGIFAVGELINYGLRGGTIAQEETPLSGKLFDGVKEVFRQKTNLLRSSLIGTLIGIVPGIGGAAANFIAYIIAKKRSRHPETFGTGNPEGVVAAESANNAKDGGALLPTIGFGIPGSVQMTLLLGAFVLHGLTPGPLLVRDHLDIVLALVLGLVVSNVLASTVGLLTARFLAKVTRVNVNYLVPVVLSLCFIGSYSLRENIWDVLVTLGFGLLGYGMVRA
ncbi:MAG: tripartite tricarboxylate transporter permease, partial [Candidatus Aminicenantes bacterium]|nr:tripartite tricarboxylate transporter permease [Candidatus Aminicenantes bacterium]